MISEMLRKPQVATAEIVWNLLLDHVAALVEDSADCDLVHDTTRALIHAATIAKIEESDKEIEILEAVDAEKVMMEAFEAAMVKRLAKFAYTVERADENWPAIDSLYTRMPHRLAKAIGTTMGHKMANQVYAIHRHYTGDK
ncbi:MAG: hypothetical protein WC565_04790 [Parcubacteria group bacterium]|jgi:hypothetical protein